MENVDIVTFLRARFAEEERRGDPTSARLADLESKRRLVHLLNGAGGGYIADEIREHALRLLALPYAGHPDHCPDWAA